MNRDPIRAAVLGLGLATCGGSEKVDDAYESWLVQGFLEENRVFARADGSVVLATSEWSGGEFRSRAHLLSADRSVETYEDTTLQTVQGRPLLATGPWGDSRLEPLSGAWSVDRVMPSTLNGVLAVGDGADGLLVAREDGLWHVDAEGERVLAESSHLRGMWQLSSPGRDLTVVKPISDVGSYAWPAHVALDGEILALDLERGLLRASSVDDPFEVIDDREILEYSVLPDPRFVLLSLSNNPLPRTIILDRERRADIELEGASFPSLAWPWLVERDEAGLLLRDVAGNRERLLIGEFSLRLVLRDGRMLFSDGYDRGLLTDGEHDTWIDAAPSFAFDTDIGILFWEVDYSDDDWRNTLWRWKPGETLELWAEDVSGTLHVSRHGHVVYNELSPADPPVFQSGILTMIFPDGTRSTLAPEVSGFSIPWRGEEHEQSVLFYGVPRGDGMSEIVQVPLE